MNGFTWLLLAFPVYLLAKRRFVDYVQLLGSAESQPQAEAQSTGRY